MSNGPVRAASPTGLLDLVGLALGETGWREISQEMVDRFADLTDDHQWIHTDPARAAGGPFGGTVVHGYLTLALLPSLLAELLVVEAAAMGVNYGLNRVRFPSPLMTGDSVRASGRISSAVQVGGGVQAEATLTLHARHSTKPVCVADLVFRYYS